MVTARPMTKFAHRTSGLTTLAVLALATVITYSTVANAKTADPLIYH